MTVCVCSSNMGEEGQGARKSLDCFLPLQIMLTTFAEWLVSTRLVSGVILMAYLCTCSYSLPIVEGTELVKLWGTGLGI